MTMSQDLLKTILAELRRGLEAALGDRLESVYLFGSTARGEADPESDIDVLIVIRGPVDYGDLMRQTSALISQLSLAHDVVLSRSFVSKERFEREQSPFLLNVRREGVLI
jgi:uncharacterized protein